MGGCGGKNGGCDGCGCDCGDIGDGGGDKGSGSGGGGGGGGGGGRDGSPLWSSATLMGSLCLPWPSGRQFSTISCIIPTS